MLKRNEGEKKKQVKASVDVFIAMEDLVISNSLKNLKVKARFNIFINIFKLLYIYFL